jgi:hypothetical protein
MIGQLLFIVLISIVPALIGVFSVRCIVRSWEIDTKLKKARKERDILIIANKCMLQFLWPEGEWRGNVNMDGILEPANVLRKSVEKVEGKDYLQTLRGK